MTDSQLSGSIASIRFYNEETGYCVLRVSATGHRRQVTVIGVSPAPTEGEYIEARGTWEAHPTHGEQFKAQELRVLAPRTVYGITRFLGSGAITGIGKTYAKKIVEKFGESLPDVIANRPSLLETVPGIGYERRKKIVASWEAFSKQRDLLIFLHSHGIGGATASRICRIYGEKTGEILRADPYRLCSDVDGIGFKTADQIAACLKITPDSGVRIRAALLESLKRTAQQGHCLMLLDDLVAGCQKLLLECNNQVAVPDLLVMEGIETCVKNSEIVADDGGGVPCYYLPAVHRAEVSVAAEMERLLRGRTPWPNINVPAALEWASRKVSISLTNSQQDAVRLVLDNKVTVITGGPGTGKSTVVKNLLLILRAKGVRILLGAPTGRAARRLAEATGMPATTLHRLLGYDGRTRRYSHHGRNRLPCDLVVVDEASMVGVRLMSSLLQAIPDHAGLLLLGDIDQLASIEAGSVLQDIIDSGAIHVSLLTEIHRQGPGSAIVTRAQMINQGICPDPDGDEQDSEFRIIEADSADDIASRIIDTVCDELPSRYGLDPRRDIQLLSPTHRGPLGTRALNAKLQHILGRTGAASLRRGGTEFREGDKVIQLVNDHDREVYNGDLGFIEHIDIGGKRVTVNFDGRCIGYTFAELEQLAIGFCITAHKCQGSEFPAVVMPLTVEHFVLLDRKLLYTAVTRGKSRVVLVGQRRALRMAVNNVRSRARATGLVRRLQLVAQSLSKEDRVCPGIRHP